MSSQQLIKRLIERGRIEYRGKLHPIQGVFSIRCFLRSLRGTDNSLRRTMELSRIGNRSRIGSGLRLRMRLAALRPRSAGLACPEWDGGQGNLETDQF
jgi:hypothetical protein